MKEYLSKDRIFLISDSNENNVINLMLNETHSLINCFRSIPFEYLAIYLKKRKISINNKTVKILITYLNLCEKNNIVSVEGKDKLTRKERAFLRCSLNLLLYLIKNEKYTNLPVRFKAYRLKNNNLVYTAYFPYKSRTRTIAFSYEKDVLDEINKSSFANLSLKDYFILGVFTDNIQQENPKTLKNSSVIYYNSKNNYKLY